MTITSVGYEGTVGDAQWAAMSPRVGGVTTAVDDYASFRVAATTGTRAVSVAAGAAWASGVYDVSNAPETKSLASVPSGSRWDMIVLRRNWATKVTSIEIIQGGSNQELPTRNNTPGTLVDQPLALCRVAAGATVVQEIIDLRCLAGDGGFIAFHDLARSYLNRVGTSVRIGDTVWSRVINVTGSPVWVSSDMGDTGWIEVPYGAGWGEHTADLRLRVRRLGWMVELRGAAKRTGNAASVSLVGTVPAAFAPTTLTPLGATYGSAGMIAEKFVFPTGVVGVGFGHITGSAPLNSILMLQGVWARG